MAEKKAIANIQKFGVCNDNGEERQKILVEDIGFPLDQRAEYVLLSGCFGPKRMPQAFAALKGFLERFRIDYTFLSMEFCCGWVPLLVPAIMAKEYEKVSKLKEIAGGFIQQNIRQAEVLGAKTIVTICTACEPNYRNYKNTTGLEILSYPQLLARFFKGGKLILGADYYQGCYRFRHAITSVAFDFESINHILGKIEGLNLNYIESKLCCIIPKQMEGILRSTKTNTIITTCNGCFHSLKEKMGENSDHKVKMLQEIVWEAVRDAS